MGEALFVPPPVAVGGLVAVIQLEPVDAPVAQLAGHDGQVLEDDLLVDVGAVAAGAARAGPGVPAVGHAAIRLALVPGHQLEVLGDGGGVDLQARQRVGAGPEEVALRGQALSRSERLAVGQVGALGGQMGEARAALLVFQGAGGLVGDARHRRGALEAEGARHPGLVTVEVLHSVVPAGHGAALEGAGHDDGVALVLLHVAGHQLRHEVEGGVGAVLQDAVAGRVGAQEQAAVVAAVRQHRAGLGQQDGLGAAVGEGELGLEPAVGMGAQGPAEIGLAVVEGQQLQLSRLALADDSSGRALGGQLGALLARVVQAQASHGVLQHHLSVAVQQIEPAPSVQPQAAGGIAGLPPGRVAHAGVGRSAGGGGEANQQQQCSAGHGGSGRAGSGG